MDSWGLLRLDSPFQGCQSPLHHDHRPGLPEGSMALHIQALRQALSWWLFNRAPTVYWAHGHSGATRFLSSECTAQRVQRTESFSLGHFITDHPQWDPVAGDRVRSPDPGPQVLAAHQDCHPSKPVSHRTGRWGSTVTQSWGAEQGQPPEPTSRSPSLAVLPADW